ncbi:hypothetical protein HDU79_011927, partial [Rhizoclosmatium sp. JEL0117]
LENGIVGYSLKDFALFLSVVDIGKDAKALNLVGTEVIHSDTLIATKDGLRILCCGNNKIAKKLLSLFLGIIGNDQSNADVHVARDLIFELGGLHAVEAVLQQGLDDRNDLSKYTELLPAYVRTLQSSMPGTRDLVWIVLQCFGLGCGDMEALWYQIMCTTVLSKYSHPNGLRYSPIEWNFWELFFSMASAAIIRLLRGGGSAAPGQNLATIMIPDIRALRRSVNNRTKSTPLDFEQAITIASMILPSLTVSVNEETKSTAAKRREVETSGTGTNPNMLKALESRQFKLESVTVLYNKAKYVFANIIAILNLLDKNIHEINCRGICTSQQPFYISDLNTWEGSPFGEDQWRELLIDLVNITSLFEQEWSVHRVPTADQLFAVVVSDSMGGKYSTIATRAVSKSGEKVTTYCWLWELCVKLFQESKLLIRTIVTDGEFMSRIGEPIPGQGFTLFRNLCMKSKSTVDMAVVGTSGTAKYFKHTTTIASLQKESFCLVAWQSQSLQKQQRMTLHQQAAQQFVVNFLAEPNSGWKSCALKISEKMFFAPSKVPNILPTIGNLVQLYTSDFKVLMADVSKYCKLKRQKHMSEFMNTQIPVEDQDFFATVQTIISLVNSNSTYLSSGPMANLLKAIHLHMRISIDLAHNRKQVPSSTSLNVDIYCPCPHPLMPTKTMFWTPNYDHLIAKNLVKGVMACDFLGIRGSLLKVMPQSWFSRDDQDVRKGCEAFSESTLISQDMRNNILGSEFMRTVANMYDAVDTSGFSDDNRIRWATEMERLVLHYWGERLSNPTSCTNANFDGLSWQVVLGLLILARNYVYLSTEIINELSGNSAKSVLFVGRATFVVTLSSSQTKGQGRNAKASVESLKLSAGKAILHQNAIVTDPGYSLGFNNRGASYAEKSSIEKIDHWNKSHLKRSSSSGSVSSASKKSLSFSQTPLTNSQRQNRQQQPSVRDQARIRGIKAGAAISEKMFYSASPSTPESADRNNINDNEN